MSRPTQLSPTTLVLLLGSSAISFISGAVIWYARHDQGFDAEPSGTFPVGPWLAIHGAVNPLLCILFGYLWFHYRGGWAMRANRVSGSILFTIFAVLILTGVGLYYVGDEKVRGIVGETHEIVGTAFPLALGWHAISGWRRSKKV